MEEQRRFSIVVPVYNAEAYLDTCINGVINQTIGFINNVELVLVNDGSKDNSGDICQRYLDLYPDNVVYISQENAGPSAARNKGIEMASGEIIGFVDADDKLSMKTLELVSKYFDVALDTADVAIIPVMNFGAKTIPYYLNGKFKKGSRTLELDNPQWNSVCMRVGQAFIRSEAAKKHVFDNSIIFFEDAKYINEVIKEKMRMGVVTGCSYYYRRYPSEADSDTSLTTGAETNKRLYLETPVKVDLHFLEQYSDENDTPLYFQYLALCEMRWRIFYTSNRTSEFLSVDEFEEYEAINERIFHYVSDYAIMTFSHYQDWQKLYLLNMKHKTNVLRKCKINNNQHVIWRGHTLSDLSKAEALLLDMDIVNNCLFVKGVINALLLDNVVVFARVNGERIEVVPCLEGMLPTQSPLDYEVYKLRGFEMRTPLPSQAAKITFGMEINGEEYEINDVKPSQRGNIDNVQPVTQVRNGYFIHRVIDGIEVYKATPIKKLQWTREKISHKIKNILKRLLAGTKKILGFPLRKLKKILK